MANDSNKKFVEQMFNEVMHEKNLSLVDKFIDPKFIHHGIPGSKNGPAVFKETMQGFFNAYPHSQFNAEHNNSDCEMDATL